jgi:ADP-glucose pyrophosphorylase
VDRDVKIPAGLSVGYRHEDDAKSSKVTESGVVVVARGEQIQEEGGCQPSSADVEGCNQAKATQ